MSEGLGDWIENNGITCVRNRMVSLWDTIESDILIYRLKYIIIIYFLSYILKDIASHEVI